MMICTRFVLLIVQPVILRAVATVSASTRTIWSSVRVNQDAQLDALAMIMNASKQRPSLVQQQLEQRQQKPPYRRQKY